MKKVIVIGGGAAGMMAALAASKHAEVELYERNEKTGKKIYITGKGRCNVTNACETEELMESIIRNKNFMYSSIYGFSNTDTMELFNSLGLKLKCERGNRIFPVSDHSSDVIKALNDGMKKGGVKVHLNTGVKDIVEENGNFSYIILDNGEKRVADACIVATGGLSYPSTGSTGDGYEFAEKFGHKIEEQAPSLVGIKVKDAFVKDLEGLSLKNVKLSAYVSEKQRYNEFGEMLFTHDGISGPIVLTMSSLLNVDLMSKKNIRFEIDLKPALDEGMLDSKLLRIFEQYSNKCFKNVFYELLPRKLIPVMIKISGIGQDRRINAITKEERQRMIKLMKHFPLEFSRLGSYNEAVITRGGINVKQIDPGTMESKLVKNLYFAGEVLDVDALTGGFNLQIAWSTGFAAGCAAAND